MQAARFPCGPNERDGGCSTLLDWTHPPFPCLHPQPPRTDRNPPPCSPWTWTWCPAGYLTQLCSPDPLTMVLLNVKAETACEQTAGCNAINYLPGKDEFQLRACATPSAPTWSVAGWEGYATFPFPPPPPPPPSPPPLPLILLTKQAAETGAACLDGSPPGYYWEAGKGTDANNWVVFLNGGGWCYTLAPSMKDPFSEPGPGGTSWVRNLYFWTPGAIADCCGSRSHTRRILYSALSARRILQSSTLGATVYIPLPHS